MFNQVSGSVPAAALALNQLLDRHVEFIALEARHAQIHVLSKILFLFQGSLTIEDHLRGLLRGGLGQLCLHSRWFSLRAAPSKMTSLDRTRT